MTVYFETTNVELVDELIDALYQVSRSFHNTDRWDQEVTLYDGTRVVGEAHIQESLNNLADYIKNIEKAKKKP